MTSFMHRGTFHLDNDTSDGMHRLRNICGFNEVFINENGKESSLVCGVKGRGKEINSEPLVHVYLYLSQCRLCFCSGGDSVLRGTIYQLAEANNNLINYL